MISNAVAYQAPNKIYIANRKIDRFDTGLNFNGNIVNKRNAMQTNGKN